MYPIAVSKKGGIKMCEFKVGDEVYFSPYNLNYYESHGVIIRFEQSIDQKRKFAVIHCGHGIFAREYHVFPENLYHTEEEALDILRQELRARINEIKKDIHTLEDLLKFLYNNDISIDAAGKGDDYCVWEERIAVRELVKEICGIDLGE